MIQNKYGEYTEQQFEAFKKKLHKWVHWCLIYAESSAQDLLPYINKVQKKFNGLNDLLLDDPNVVEIMTLIEAARIEFEETQDKTPLFRKYILDAHEIIDMICQTDSKEG